MMADLQHKTALRKWIIANLSRDQLVVLAADLGVDYENLVGGESKSSKTLQLIGYLERRGRVDELFEAVDRIRADPSLLQEESGGLPGRCPACNAPLRPDEIRWYNPSVAQCAYCGITVKAGRG